jgi:ubiquinone/menaquinone biosynthesis C-methylase UbiE
MSKRLEKKKMGWLTASSADIHDLYQRAVQCPESEVNLVYQSWKEMRNRVPHSVREDFCGTSAVAREWVRRSEENTVIGVDLDPGVLAWSRSRMDESLTPEQRSRVKLVEHDVMKVDEIPVDCVLAMNFSYYGFKKRTTLLKYFHSVCGSLKEDG